MKGNDGKGRMAMGMIDENKKKYMGDYRRVDIESKI